MLKAMLRRGALTDRLVGDLDQAVSLWLDATTAPPWERGISQPEAVLLADTARTLTQQLRPHARHGVAAAGIGCRARPR
jgi:hypothetical protein